VAIGYRAKNRKMLQQKFTEVKFKTDETLVKGEFFIQKSSDDLKSSDD